jgi:hypothetical protein
MCVSYRDGEMFPSIRSSHILCGKKEDKVSEREREGEYVSERERERGRESYFPPSEAAASCPQVLNRIESSELV